MFLRACFTDHCLDIRFPDRYVHLACLCRKFLTRVHSVLGFRHCALPRQNHQSSQFQHARFLGRALPTGGDRYVLTHFATNHMLTPSKAFSLQRVLASSPSGSWTHIVCRMPHTPPVHGFTFSLLGICKIWHYKRKITKLRAKAGLPELYDPDDLPDPVYDPNYIHVLSEHEQIDLHYRKCLFVYAPCTS